MIRNLNICLVIGLLFVIFYSGCKKDDYKDLDCGKVNATYNSTIKSIINSNCAFSGCHGAGSANNDYTNYNGLKSIADNGKLEDRVLVKKNMPSSGALSLDDRKKIKCWLESGSPNN